MRITNDWLVEFCTERGGWTSAQLRIIGVKWPPRPGWKQTVIGKEISEEEAEKFENARFELARRTVKNLAKRERNHGWGKQP